MTRHNLIWGWLRILLGVMQTSLAAAGIWMLLTIGSRPVTLIVVGGALTATIISRLIYKGRSDPALSDTKGEVTGEVK